MRLRRVGLRVGTIQGSRGSWLAAALSVLALANCECEPTLNRVAPKIELADPFDASISVCAEQGIRECAYDFGEVQIGQGRMFRFLIKNPSPVDLVLHGVSFSPESDPAFSLKGDAPTVVLATPGREGVEVIVQFTPTVEAEVFGTLIIDSDAANLDPDEKVLVELKGRGLDLGAPSLSVNPTLCDFGEVGVGVTAFCDLALENVGQRELIITGIGFSPDTDQAVFGPSGVFPIPTTIQTQTGVSLRLWARPDEAGEITGTLLLDSTDPENAQIPVPLRVMGAEAPTAIAEVKEVNGSPPPSGSVQVRPLDDVVLTGVNSQPALADGSISAYQWEIIEKPAESSVQLSQPNAMETGFFFSSTGGNRAGLDVAGTFVVRLAVTDNLGAVSTNDARVTLSSVPSERLHVQLTWDAASNDIDLHLVKSGGEYCSDDSCYYANCKSSSNSFPEWDGISGRSAGDPSLDVDDLSGYGPENINVDAPVNGTYTAGVHFFSGSAATTVTVKIYVNGGLAFEDYKQFNSDDDFWEVAEVQWLNGGAIVAPVGGFETNWSCPW